MVRKNNFEQIV